MINLTKKEVQQRVLKNGKPLGLNLFTWNRETHTFSSKQSGLVIDFGNFSLCVFETEHHCIFKTGSLCTFDTGPDCVFCTGFHCNFDTGHDCTFDTGPLCTFKTGPDCVVVRRDVYEVIELKAGQKIKLNSQGIKGFVILNKKVEKHSPIRKSIPNH